MRFLLRITAAVAVLLSASSGWAKVKVVSTLPDYGALVRSIGGEHVDVKVLSSPLEDPHYVDAKPSFIVHLNRADLLISNGLELEIGWLPNLVIQSRNSKIQPGQLGHLEVSTYITRLRDVPRGTVDRSMGDIHMGGNPHYYHDPSRMLTLLSPIAKRLMEIDPANASAYEDNLRKTKAQFKVFLNEVRALFSKLSAEQRKVVAYHKSFGYLFETLGIKAVAYMEPKPGVAPTPAHVSHVLSLMKRDKIGVIIQEAYYPTSTSSVLAKLTGGEVVKVLAGADKGQTYLQHLKKITDSIYDTLQRGGNT